MDLPDAPTKKKEAPQLSESQAAMVFQEHQTNVEEKKENEGKPKISKKKEIEQSIVSMAAEYAASLEAE